MATKTNEPKKTVHRDSRNGQFITGQEAKRRPATTEKERVRTGKK